MGTKKNSGRRIVLAATTSPSLSFFGTLPSLLRSEGWEVHVVSHKEPDAPYLASSFVTSHHINMRRNPSVWSDLLSLLRWIRLLKMLKPLVVFAGTPKASFLAILAAWLCKVPIRVYGLWGLRLETSSGLRRWIFSRIEALTAKASSAVLAVSPSLKKQFVDSRLSPDNKIVVLGKGSSHGVNVEIFKPFGSSDASKQFSETLSGNSSPRIGFVGRFSEDKGANTILMMRRLLLARGVDHQLIIAGPIENCHEKITELQEMGAGVHVLGRVNWVDKLYPLFDLLILPTLREGFPNVVLEAAACGVPTVTTSATGAVDSVIHNLTGVIVPKDLPEHFAQSVLELIEDPVWRIQLGENARVYVHKHFTEKLVVSMVAKFLHSLTLPLDEVD